MVICHSSNRQLIHQAPCWEWTSGSKSRSRVTSERTTEVTRRERGWQIELIECLWVTEKWSNDRNIRRTTEFSAWTKKELLSSEIGHKELIWGRIKDPSFLSPIVLGYFLKYLLHNHFVSMSLWLDDKHWESPLFIFNVARYKIMHE